MRGPLKRHPQLTPLELSPPFVSFPLNLHLFFFFSPPCPQSVIGLFTHPLSLQHCPTLFSQLLFSSPLYIPSMFTLVSLASPRSSLPANVCVLVNAAPYFQHFIILISLQTSSFISLYPFFSFFFLFVLVHPHSSALN